MQVNRISPQSTNFQSKFVNNSVLNQAFDRAIEENDRFFVKSMKALMNDGKDDILELQRRNPRHLDLYVNGEIAEEGQIFLNYYVNVGTDLIKKYASRVFKENMQALQHSNLSTKEKELVQEEVDLIKLISENFPSSIDFIGNVQKTLNTMKDKLDKNTKQELIELKKAIFDK